MKKTKIICTIGPKTKSITMISKLIKNGMDIARLNFSHGNYIEYSRIIKDIRFLSNKFNKYIPILLDTKGPEFRICKFKNSSKIFLKKGQNIKLTYNKLSNNDTISVNNKYFYKSIKLNRKIFLDDGLIRIKIIDIKYNIVICKVLNSGFLEENKKINIIDLNEDICYISENDKKDLEFGCKNKVDFIAISFVRNSNDIKKIKNFIISINENKIIPIISKIENKSSLKNLDEIIKESYGIMIARGDLGINIPIENVIIEQKKIINKCNLNNKPVITATHMLESMIKNPFPTRAEAGDIFNAIKDGTDCVMLSGESANGKYPIESIKIMKKICNKTDNLIKNKTYNNKYKYYNYLLDLINKNNINNFKLIVIVTNNSDLVKYIRNNNPFISILNITNSNENIKNLFLTRSVTCYKLYENLIINKNLINNINLYINNFNILKENDMYILLYNIYLEQIDTCSILKFKLN